MGTIPIIVMPFSIYRIILSNKREALNMNKRVTKVTFNMLAMV